MIFVVESVQTVAIKVTCKDTVFTLSEKEAIELAVMLAFIADGNLVKSTDCSSYTVWNFNSKFHEAYRKYIQSES